MGKELALSDEGSVPAGMWNGDDGPAPKLLDILNQVTHFVEQLGYSKSASSLRKEASKNNLDINTAEWVKGKDHVPLLDLYKQVRDVESEDDSDKSDESDDDEEEESDESEDSGSGEEGEESEDEDPIEGMLVDVEAEETSDDGSNEGGDEGPPKGSSTTARQKRKRVLTPPSSDEDSSESDDSDSESGAGSLRQSTTRPAKKVKVDDSDTSSASDTHSDSDSDPDSSDTSSSSSENEGSAQADSGSDSDSDSSDSSESSDSDDGSSASSSASSSSASPPKTDIKKNKKNVKAKTKNLIAKAKQSPAKPSSESASVRSTSSDTLDGEPTAEVVANTDYHVHPARLGQVVASEGEDLLVSDNVHPERAKRLPATKENVKQLKKQQIPFSRIPVDQKVDPRFSSNAYVPYDYANRAHQDLIVTKGKGFTKEKNKKKRGAYRGGIIDTTPKGIKFDD